jgi:hypothetical protein
MAVRYFPIDGESVSAHWYPILKKMRADGVYFNVNEGHRTWARQAYFWALYQSGRGNLAARPSNNAPHIWTGRQNHAIDFNNAGAVVRWLRNHGVAAVTNVPGESWHVYAPADDLARLAKKLGGGHRTLKRGMRGKDVQRLQVLLRGVNRWPKKRKTGKTFGLRTKYALMGYQASQGLKADGIYGPTTRRHLEADYKRKNR